MTLNVSGPISLGGDVLGQSIALELAQAPNATISLNDLNVRTLADVAVGAITMPTNFYGKTAPTTFGDVFHILGLPGIGIVQPIGVTLNTPANNNPNDLTLVQGVLAI